MQAEGGGGLDKQNPYQGTASTPSYDFWIDAPGAALTSATWLFYTNSFRTFLMFQPTNGTSVAVPLYQFTWHWGGVATNGPPWGKLSGSADETTPVPTEIYPIWTNIIHDVNTTNAIRTNCFL